MSGKELCTVRRFPEMDPRVESGPIMFGDDWPGLATFNSISMDR